MQELGRTLEAQWVIWGEYRLTGSIWELSVRKMNISSGKVSEVLNLKTNDVFSAVSHCADSVLGQLNIKVTPEEKRQIFQQPTKSFEALDLWSRSYCLLDSGHAEEVAEAATNLEKAVALDRKFELAVQALARCLIVENKSEEALQWSKREIELDPNGGAAHCTRGMIYLAMDLKDLAIDDFVEASKLSPDQPENDFYLGTCFTRQGKWKSAVEAFEKAKKLAPFDSPLRGRLGYAYAILGDREHAYSELNAAKEFDTREYFEVKDSLAQAYAVLGDFPAAIEYYKKLTEAGKDLGVDPARLHAYEDNLREMKGRLTPHFVAALRPKDYSEKDIEDLCRTNLTPAERKFAINPLSGTPPMYAWGEKLTAGTQSQLETAKRLFEALMNHSDPVPEKFSRKTATDVFKDWSKPGVEFGCQDYTVLYVALARHLGLNAYYVLVDKDYEGKTVGHACAGVFIDGKALLVDPAMQWFGVPHQSYEFENDRKVISYFFSQSSDVDEMMASLKLSPDWPRLYFSVAMSLVTQDSLDKAKDVLQKGLKLDSETWFARYAQGMVEIANKDETDGILHLKQSLNLRPDNLFAHFALANTFLAQGKLKDARQEFRVYSETATDSEEVAAARDAILRIDEQLDHGSTRK